jgi:hypothetical protein
MLSFIKRSIQFLAHLAKGYVSFCRHIKSNNSGMAKVKIVKNKRDPPLFTSKQLINF